MERLQELFTSKSGLKFLERIPFYTLKLNTLIIQFEKRET